MNRTHPDICKYHVTDSLLPTHIVLLVQEKRNDNLRSHPCCDWTSSSSGMYGVYYWKKHVVNLWADYVALKQKPNIDPIVRSNEKNLTIYYFGGRFYIYIVVDNKWRW